MNDLAPSPPIVVNVDDVEPKEYFDDEPQPPKICDLAAKSAAGSSSKTLERFVAAQAEKLADVESELRQGRKVTHWMWYVFPQIAGLSQSATSKHYAITNLDEARAYLVHPTLGPRLRQHTELVTASTKSVEAIFGSPDELKFRSCITLFDVVSPGDVFEQALQKHFDGKRDDETLRLLNPAEPTT